MRNLIFVAAAVLLTVVSVHGSMQASRSARTSTEGVYSLEQATRGKALFAKACNSCHTADRAKPADTDYPMRLPIALSGELFAQKWRTAGDLYSKVAYSMPVDRVIGVSGLKPDEYVDIVAYLLQQNGLPAGRELRNDIKTMQNIPVDPTLRRGTAAMKQAEKSTGGGAVAGVDAADAYYTEAQARRGREYFLGSCSLCHTAEGKTVEEGPAWIGRLNGQGKRLNPVVSSGFATRYQNVAGLYNKVRTTMPGHDSGGLSAGAYVDMVAYILKQNGLPAGHTELTDDLEAMRGMTLLEKGFERLFNGKDFTGFKFLIGANCTPKPTGCGKDTPAPTFTISKGTIICSGKPYGFMYTDKKYLNFTLKLDYRFVPFPGMESDADYYGNSGFFLFVNKLQVWPPYIEIQPTMGVTVTGAKALFTVDAAARARALRPIGQWNSVEIVSANRQVKSSLNGVLISTVTEHEYEAGYLGFQSEGSEIHWRNIRIKAE